MAEEDNTPTIDPAEFAALRASVDKLTANNAALLQEKAETAKKAKAAEAAALAAQEEAAKKAGNVDALEKSWQAKLEAAKAEAAAQLEAANGTIKDLTAGAQARALAAELAMPGLSDGLMPHINSRLTVEFTEGGPVTRVLDKNGKPSAMTIDEFKAEIKATPYLAPMLLGSKANGSGKPGKGGDSGKPVMSRADWGQLDPVSQAKFFRDGGKVVDE